MKKQGLIFVFGLAMVGVKVFAQGKTFVPKKIVFEQTTIIEAYEPAHNINKSTPADSLFKTNKTKKILEIKGFQKNLVLEISNDSIWRYETMNGQAMEYTLHLRNGKIQIFRDKMKQVAERSYDNSNLAKAAKITVIKKDKKVILGLKCYKVILEVPTNLLTPNETIGIYEMYVTKKIKAPLYSLINIKKEYRFFPLELRMHMKEMPDISENLKAISIEK